MNVAGRAARARRPRTSVDRRRVRGRLGRPAQRRRSRSRRASTTRRSARVTFDQVVETYAEQIRGARRGRRRPAADRDDLRHAEREGGDRRPRSTWRPTSRCWISFTAIDTSGRNLSGQTVEAFWASIEHAEPLIVGVNCSLGATRDAPVRRGPRARRADVRLVPSERRPAERVRPARRAAGRHEPLPRASSRADGLVNVVGGCCGTTPEHIAAIAAAVDGLPPRRVPPRRAVPRFSGLEPFEIGPDTGFVMIGERTNVTGSARFRRLVEADDFQGAVEVALEQVRGGANMLDVNMDADLLDSEQAMTTFLNLIATEPEVARLPIMVDSSRWSVLEAGLKCLQGKGVVNSISLKEGEEAFLEQARAVRRYGAGGRRDGLRRAGPGRHRRAQGRDLRPRLRPARPSRRASRPRTSSSTRTSSRSRPGSRSTTSYAKAFIDGAAADQGALPGRAHVAAASRTSRFAFRGNDAVREAMHSAFLYHAIQRRARHGHRQRGPARGLRGHRARAARARRGRDLQPPPRRDRAARRARRARQGRGATKRERRSLLARGAGREAPRARARPRHRRLHRGGHRGGAAEARPRRST